MHTQTPRRVAEALQSRRQANQIYGNEVSVSYMQELDRRKQEMLRQRAQRESQQWQQQQH